MDGVDLDVIEGVNNAECIRRKARAHLYVDQFLMGYGTNALEAWAMGIPVVAGVGDSALRMAMLEEIGDLPFVETPIADLRQTVQRLRDDAQFYTEARDRGMAYVREFHSPKRIAGLLRDAYEQAMEQEPTDAGAALPAEIVLEAAQMDAFYRKHGALVHTKQGRHAVIAGLVEGHRVLDVGCGTGDLLLLLQRNGHERLVGTDISSVALAMARERGVRAELLQTANVPAGPFSTVVISQVLEHVSDDGAMVRAAAEQLEPGGLLIASVPMPHTSGRHHRRRYTAETFAELLSQVGQVSAMEWNDPLRYLMTARKP
jgi:2-polyprenyl-3-methyl-5-hydroxy-6-metoxy-1,4-benzoquinol methylase